MNPVNSDDSINEWLQLTLTEGIGPATARRLLNQFGMPQQILRAGFFAVSQIVGEKIARMLFESDNKREALIAQTLEWSSKPENHLITLADLAYPTQLLNTPDPPPVLYLKGNPAFLEQSSIAIVGSRNPTTQGLLNAEQFARTLSQASLTVVSGLALGIDAAAHRGALQGAGSTIAVVGTGLDTVYPAKNRELAHEIANKGLLLSEFALGTKPLSSNFPRRNRIIAGLAQATLVVEAAVQSGSLITAKLAADLGKEVLAVPGSIHSPQSRGCHSLIKQGAKLVESAQDVLEELRLEDITKNTPVQPHPSSEQRDPLLSALGGDVVHTDTLAQRTGLCTDMLMTRLTELELAGQVARLPGGLWQALY
ncbi:MAG: DNA-processing protein DprA [Burkholderiaceae bacterium]|nr:DNA-processing protein DprA [Burkholderiaceae bacterium]